MNYSVNLLTSPADCDAVLALLAKDRAALDQRRSSLQYELTQFDSTTPEVEGGLTQVAAQLAGISTYISSLPAGSDARRKVELEKERLDVRQRLLTDRQQNWGVVARLDRECDLARVVAELAELDACKAAVEARKAAL